MNGRALRNDGSGSAHHDHRRLRFGRDRRRGEGERREAEAGEEHHLVAGEELLGEAFGRLRREPGVIPDQELDLAATGHVAVSRHIKAYRRLDLASRGGERPGQGQDQAHFRRIGGMDRGRERGSRDRRGTFQESASRCYGMPHGFPPVVGVFVEC
jgi:hypothetical protein